MSRARYMLLMFWGYCHPGTWNISPFLLLSFALSRLLSLSFLHGETDGGLAVRACKLCPGRAISATTSVSTGAAWRDHRRWECCEELEKRNEKAVLCFNVCANNAFVLHRNQSASLIVGRRWHSWESLIVCGETFAIDIHESRKS